MSSVNKVIILGRLGKDPVLKNLPSGSEVCNFSVATSESWKDKNTGEKKEKAEWMNIVVFGKQASHCEKYLSKGSQVYLEGKFTTDSYEKDGVKMYSTKVIANSVKFLSSKNETAKEETKKEDYAPQAQQQFAEDNIPF